MADQFLQQLAAVSEPQLAYLVPISDDPSGTGDLKKIALSALLTLYAAAGHDHDGTYAALAHDHDDRYYLEGEVDSLISAAVSFSVARGNHTGSQAISTVTGLQTALDGKFAIGHTHAVSADAGNEASLGTDDLVYVGQMRMRSINVYSASQNIAIPTGDWQWLHIRLVGPGGGGGSSSTNSRAGQAGGAGGGVDGWISRATWDAQMAAWLASLDPSIPDSIVIVLTVGAQGSGGTPGNNGADGTVDTVIALRATEEGTPVATLTLATGALGKGGRVANQSISGFGTGGLGSFDSNWITGVAVKGDGGDGRGTVNAETGFAGGRSMLGGGGDPGPADGVGGHASGYGGGGGSGGRSSSGSNGDGGNGSPGVIILEVFD